MNQIELNINTHRFFKFLIKNFKIFLFFFSVYLSVFFLIYYIFLKNPKSYHTDIYFDPDPISYVDVNIIKGMIYKYHITNNFEKKLKDIDPTAEYRIILSQNSKFFYHISTTNPKKTEQILLFIKEFYNIQNIIEVETLYLRNIRKTSIEEFWVFYLEMIKKDKILNESTNINNFYKKIEDNFPSFLNNINYSDYLIINSNFSFKNSNWAVNKINGYYYLFYSILISLILTTISLLLSLKYKFYKIGRAN